MIEPCSTRSGPRARDARVRRLLGAYRDTLEFDRRVLLEKFELYDVAVKVVGVGSVGTRCWIALMMARGSRDPLFLQIKEADASVLEPLLGAAGSLTTASGSSPASG